MSLARPGAEEVRHELVLANLDVDQFVPHFIHDSARTWSETNCYVDLWVELLHALGADPLPATAFVFSAAFDGRQWDFPKVQPDDLRALYGIDVAEQNIWKPFADHVIENLEDGILSTVEVDGYYLPDTAASSYHRVHVKTTIVPVRVNVEAECMQYLHNSGLYELAGEDFRGALALGREDSVALAPYVERIRIDRDVLARGARYADLDLAVINSHVRRRPRLNPVALLGNRVRADMDWIRQSGPDKFHLWSFGTLRQCGASAELAADLASYLESRGVVGAGAARAPFLEVASGAKSVQFRMARAARGRAVTVDETLDVIADAWSRGMAVIETVL